MGFLHENLTRAAALCLAICGLYIFMNGGTDKQLRVLDDGSLADPQEKAFISFQYPKSILSLNVGFDSYRSVGYGLSSVCLLFDLVLGTGHLTLPALFVASGEIINDFSDFVVAVFLIGRNIGPYPAAAYGLTYLSLLAVETLLWFGTCKFHEHCQSESIKKETVEKRLIKVSSVRKAVM